MRMDIAVAIMTTNTSTNIIMSIITITMRTDIAVVITNTSMTMSIMNTKKNMNILTIMHMNTVRVKNQNFRLLLSVPFFS